MSVQRAHGHERKRASRHNATADEPITLEQYRRLEALNEDPVARMDRLAAAKREAAKPKFVTFEEAEEIVGHPIEPS